MDCVFCQIAQKSIPSMPIVETDKLLAIHDQNPQAPVHILIIPKHHIASINDAEAEHRELLGQLILTAKQLAESAGVAENGYRLIFNVNPHGGQTVYHIHLHLLGGRRMTWPPG